LVGEDKCGQTQYKLRIGKHDDSSRITLKDILALDEKSCLEPPASMTVRAQRAFGVLGFVRFLKGFYCVLISQR
jgi:hypothetical protein